MKDIITGVSIGTVGVIAYLFGDVDGLFKALIAFIILDFISGIIVAISKKELSSNICGRGIARKVLMLMIVAVGHLIDSALKIDGAPVRNVIICFYLANEGISLLENSAALGVPYPDKLIQILKQLKVNGGTKK